MDKPWKLGDLADFPDWLPQVLEWHHAEWKRLSDHPIENELAQKQKRERFLREHLNANPLPSTFIAYQGEQLAGTVSLVFFSSDVHLWLTNLYVDVPFRHQGLGQRLLKKAQSFARTQGYQELWLYTFDSEDYYLKQGWKHEKHSVLHNQEVQVLRRFI